MSDVRERPELHHLVTIPLVEAGELLGLDRDTCYKRAREGTFPVPVRRITARNLRVRLIDLEAYLDEPA